MDEPVIFISEFRLTEGAERPFTEAFADATATIAATKPRTSLYAAYLDEPGRTVRIVHAFPDASAMAAHFEGAAVRARAVSAMITPTAFTVYGNAPETSVAELRTAAAEAGAGLVLLPRPLGGFLR